MILINNYMMKLINW